jgi:hypothetical protein
VPINKILNAKNVLAWVSMVSYLKKINENKNIKEKLKSWAPMPPKLGWIGCAI